MYVLIELLEQKKTRVYRLIYTKKDKTFFQIKYLVTRFNDNDDNSSFTFETILTFFSSFLEV